MASQFVVDAFTQLDPFNLLHSREERKKVKSNVNYCSKLIFVMLSMCLGMWLQRDLLLTC
jgi:hypothetical protein